MFYSLIFATAVLFGLMMLAITKVAVSAARRLHHDLVERVLHATASFFDTTPVGRVLNWLTRDVGVLDENLPEAKRYLAKSLPRLLGLLLLICVTVPVAMGVVIPIIAAVAFVQVGTEDTD